MYPVLYTHTTVLSLQATFVLQLKYSSGLSPYFPVARPAFPPSVVATTNQTEASSLSLQIDNLTHPVLPSSLYLVVVVVALSSSLSLSSISSPSQTAHGASSTKNNNSVNMSN